MPEPYNYLPAGPDGGALQAFGQSLAFVTQQRMLQQAQQQAEAQRQAALAKQALYARLGPHSSAEDYVNVASQLGNPEEAKQLIESFNAMDKAKGSALFNAGGEAFGLLQPNDQGVIDPKRAIDKLNTAATALENSGDEENAQKLRDAAEMIAQDPQGGKHALGTLLAVIDPDRFKQVAAVGVNPAMDTAFLKELIAEGLQPGTEPFKAALRQKREEVSFYSPDLGYIRGSPEFVQSTLGGRVQGMQQLPHITTEAEAKALPPGSRFIGPDNQVHMVPGDASSNAGGGF